MRTKKLLIWVAVLVLILGVTAALAGCGGTPAASSGGTTPPPASALKIALLLPETKTTRYDTQDKPLFEAKVKATRSDCRSPLQQRQPGRRAAAVAG